jgi:hypothetical protein
MQSPRSGGHLKSSVIGQDVGVDVGYSGTPLPRKLGFRGDSRLLLVDVPDGLDLGEVPAGATIHRRRGSHPYDVILLCVADRRALEKRMAGLVAALEPNGALWVCWPKRSSGVRTDLTESVVRDHGLQVGLVDVKVAAIDLTWSGLKFVRRLADRPPRGTQAVTDRPISR